MLPDLAHSVLNTSSTSPSSFKYLLAIINDIRNNSDGATLYKYSGLQSFKRSKYRRARTNEHGDTHALRDILLASSTSRRFKVQPFLTSVNNSAANSFFKNYKK